MSMSYLTRSLTKTRNILNFSSSKSSTKSAITPNLNPLIVKHEEIGFSQDTEDTIQTIINNYQKEYHIEHASVSGLRSFYLNLPTFYLTLFMREK